MSQGVLVDWLVDEGDSLTVGAEVAEVETEKITGAIESPVAGVLRRRVAQVGQTVPVGGLLAVVAGNQVSEQEIDAFVQQFRDAPPDMAESTPDRSPEELHVGGRRIRHLQMGARGEAVVFIHGFTGSLNNWVLNQTALAERYQTYSLDLPGHGGSSKDVGDGSLVTLTRAVLDWLDAVEIERPHLIGHSLGGALTLAVALQRPEQIRSCTILASAALGPEIDAEFLRGVVAAQRRKDLKPLLQRLFAAPEHARRSMIDDVLKFKRLDGVQEALEKIVAHLLDGDQQARGLRDELPQIRPPVNVIWGEQDRIIPVAHTHDLPDRFNVHRLPDCGHMLHLEAAQEVNRLLSNFLAAQ